MTSLSEEIVYNEQYDLYVPAFEPRLMNKDWFKKTFDNIGRELKLVVDRTRGNHEKVCVQAGGHLGIYPKYLSRHFDEVYTFEADPVLFECVKKNIGNRNITAINAALSNKHGMATFHRTGKSGAGSLVPNMGKFDTIQVNTICIDSLDLPHCDAICLDIERGEPAALIGAYETIKKFKPIIQVEMHDKSRKEIDTILRNMNYKFLMKAGSRDEVYVPV